MNNRNNGFTLVELAIVIVIIGLLTVGVMQGQSLIQSSRINSTVSKVQSYNGAVTTFRGKYNQLPGDIVRPYKFGLNAAKNSTIVNVCATNGTPVSTTAGGEGDGDNLLGVADPPCNATSGGGNSNSPPFYFDFSSEVANFWVHLSNAQLISEGFNQATPNLDAGTSYPTMPVGTAMTILPENGLNYWVLGSPITLSGGIRLAVTSKNLSPSEAATIDIKIDDGNPTTGIAQVVGDYNGGFLTTNTVGATYCAVSSSSYNINSVYENQRLCSLKILPNF